MFNKNKIAQIIEVKNSMLFLFYCGLGGIAHLYTIYILYTIVQVFIYYSTGIWYYAI